MKRKNHIVKVGDPRRAALLKDLEGIFICSPGCEKYRIDMLEEDGLKRVRTLILITACGSEAIQ